ncbi:MAG: hypothetical protein MRECE_13c042 [Mycoplasmataceae bacterium CE_OT135]|nr:MAG: hypothetical protein MRECE_13c042 [Mycoplasmataceae bacterium CE_OT135]
MVFNFINILLLIILISWSMTIIYAEFNFGSFNLLSGLLWFINTNKFNNIFHNRYIVK